MFKRFRQLHISLAAKCQILFGAAVLLIIAAALFVPWQRMEQLMEQMNEGKASALADWAEAEHIAAQAEGARAKPTTRPQWPLTLPTHDIGRAGWPLTLPTTLPAASAGDGTTVRMLLMGGEYRGLTRFEARALDHFRADPGADPLFRTQSHRDAPDSFRYARALYAEPHCIRCHSADLSEPVRRAMQAGTLKRAPLLGLVSIEIPYQVDAKQMFLNRFFMFVAGVLAGTLAIIVFYLITTRLILQPVRVLQETAEKVSQGDLNIRSDINTGDEFQQLSETFNRMLTNLQEGEEQLRAINKSLDLKLGQLAESNLALYESNRLKNEFLANVSHELRTPLNSILGFADLLKDSAGSGDAKAVRYLQNIISSGRHLLGLITDLLDLAKIEAGRMEVRSEKLSLGDLFEGLINIIKPLAEQKDLSVVATVAREVPILQTDPAKLQQVLYNFLSNAIKFSPEHGRIDLRALRANGDVRISVTDQGPGIELDKHAVIFEKFRQIDGSVTREHGGTGLGLAISRELTTLLGGSIGVESRPGEGATFWVLLPVKTEAGLQPVQVASEPVLKE